MLKLFVHPTFVRDKEVFIFSAQEEGKNTEKEGDFVKP
jgi:hypothetical protein